MVYIQGQTQYLVHGSFDIVDDIHMVRHRKQHIRIGSSYSPRVMALGCATHYLLVFGSCVALRVGSEAVKQGVVAIYQLVYLLLFTKVCLADQSGPKK